MLALALGRWRTCPPYSSRDGGGTPCSFHLGYITNKRKRHHSTNCETGGLLQLIDAVRTRSICAEHFNDYRS